MQKNPTYEEFEKKLKQLETSAAEHRRITQALKESEERYRLLAENVTDVIWVMDENLNYTYISPSIQRLSGFTPEEAMKQTVLDQLITSSFESAYEAFQKHIKAFLEAPDDPLDPLTMELEDIRKDGSRGWSEINTTLLRSPEGNFAGIVGVSRDITKRKRAEEELKKYRNHLEEVVTQRTGELRNINEELQLEINERNRAEAALRESEERLELALLGADLGLWDWKVQTGEIIVNQRCAEMLGYALDEIEINIHWFKESLHPDENLRVVKEVVAHLEGKTTQYETEIRLRAKSGDWKSILARGRVVERDASGEPLRVTGTILDITRRKQAEEEKTKLEAQLHQSQKMEAIGRLAGGISHDLNNLLTAISVSADLLLLDIFEKDPLHREGLEIKKTVEQATSLTKQLIAFSRKQILEPKVLNINDVVIKMQGMLSRLIGEDIELEALLNNGIGQVKADLGQLEQVIMNLVLNARDAMIQGGKVTIETANAKLGEDDAREQLDAEPGPYVMLTVRDTGCGMEEEVKAQIFEPFFTTKEIDKGTGLGLSTVFGIIKQSNGHISVTSMPGRGTSVTICLPRVTDTIDLPEPSPPKPKTLQGSETVLLVEDDKTIRRAVREILQRSGYRVLEAPNPGDALLISEQHTGLIHLMLTDVAMPRMSGPDLAQRLAPWHPEMKVLYMSGHSEKDMIQNEVLPQKISFLQKPFSLADLLQKVRQVIDTPRREELISQ